MSRDSCISHKAKGVFLKLRKDYRQLMGGDNVASALLSVFEYWADGMIATNSQLAKAASIWVGSRSILQFEEMLIGLASDKRIRLGLKKLADFGYIKIKGKASNGTPRSYCFMVDVVQKDLDGLSQLTDRTSIRKPRSIDRPPSVNEPTPPRSIDRPPSVNEPTPPRSIDRPPSVNEPTPPRSIDQTSISKNSLKEEERSKKEAPELSLLSSASLSEPEPVAAELPALTSPLKDANAPSSTGNETVSADPRKIFTKENIEAKEWAMHEAPWRLSVAEYQPAMFTAVAKSMGKFAQTEEGLRNDGWIIRHLQNLERNGRENRGQESIAARMLLLTTWTSAEALEASQQSHAEVCNPPPAPIIEPEDPETVRAAQAAARRIIQEARAKNARAKLSVK